MIAVLRLGHRIARDKRITTHVALVARTFGADHIYITTKDQTIEDNLQSIAKRWGNTTFHIQTGVKAKQIINNWNGTIIHLTMYGQQLKDAMPTIDKTQDTPIIIGAEKVPAYIYQEADINVAVGNQPHSEVAALAIFLDRLTDGTWENTTHHDGALYIEPNPKGKTVKKTEDNP